MLVNNSMLHCSPADLRLFGATEYGAGVGPIHFSDVMCTGNEPSLFNCTATSTPTDCDHSEDAGLRCEVCKYIIVIVLMSQNCF